jgi:RecA-family ATPase
VSNVSSSPNLFYKQNEKSLYYFYYKNNFITTHEMELQNIHALIIHCVKNTQHDVHTNTAYRFFLSSFLGSTAQHRSWLPPQNLAEFLGGFSTIFFFTG